MPNHALQRTRHGVVVRDRSVPCAGSLSLGRSMKTYSTLAFVAVLVLIAGCEAPKSEMKVHRDYVTDLDFTTTTDFDAATLLGRNH